MLYPSVKKFINLQQIFYGLILIGCLAFIAVSTKDILLILPFPPGMDQDAYLLAGREFAERHVFMWRAPLYSAWVGAIYSLCNKNLEVTFYVEKVLSIALLSILTGILGWRLFDKWTGMLMATWVWSCKYLLIETNGSHTLAASLLTLSMLSLCRLNISARIPVALFFLYLSAMCRSEMWLVLFVYFIALILKRIISSKIQFIELLKMTTSRLKYLIIVLILGTSLHAIFTCNISISEPNRLSVAFGQNFAVNYVERNGIQKIYPDAWSNWRSIWKLALPDATTPFDALLKYPMEISGHLLYNIKLSIKALPAMIFAFSYPFLTIGLFSILSMFVIYNTKIIKHDYDSELSMLLLIFVLSTFIMIPVSIVLRVAARYYIQLIPVSIVAIIALIKLSSCYLKSRPINRAVDCRS